MPDLGKKFECYSCGTKFYNLNKPEAVCPKCGANQKEARTEDAPTPAPRPARRAAILEPIPDEQPNEFGEEGPAAEDDDDGELGDEDEAEEKEKEEEEEF
jgi:hypothetical protein